MGTGSDTSGFNFGRNVRSPEGNSTPYTLAPGREYRNFAYYAFGWR